MNNNKKIIAILADGFLNWQGGIDFLMPTILGTLVVNENYDIHLLFPKKRFFRGMSLPFIRKEVAKSIVTTNEMFRYFDGISNINITFCDFSRKSINKKLAKINANLAIFCWGDIAIDIPSMGYYPDLQHKYLPEFFSQEEINDRNTKIPKILDLRKGMLVHSKAVKNDLLNFFPGHECQIFDLPFAPICPMEWFTPKTQLLNKYHIDYPYFMISNQFWVHKSYETAFESLKQIPDVHLICTGPTDDFRFPNYFNEIKQKITNLKLNDRVHILGLVPKNDQIEIMRNALTVIQPSSFEGAPGGGSTSNAVSLGVPVILSDITTNKEIEDENNVFFFETNNHDDLILKMEYLLNTPLQRPSKDQLIQKRENNIIKKGKATLAAIDTIVKL